MERYITHSITRSPIMPPKAKDKKSKMMDNSIEHITESQNMSSDHSGLMTQLSDFFSPQLDAIKKELDGITNVITVLASDLKQFAVRLTEAEDRISNVEDQYNRQEELVNKHDNKLFILAAKIEDIEDRARRNNIRLVGLPETPAYDDLIYVTSQLLPQILGFPKEKLPIAIERAHRVGSIRYNQDGSRRDRMLIFKVLNFQDKLKYFEQYRKNSSLSIDNHKILLFQDFSNETQIKRKEMSPFFPQLIDKGYKVRMIYPAKIIVENNGKTNTLNNSQEVRDFLIKDKS